MNNDTITLPAIAYRFASLTGQFVGVNWNRRLKTYKGETAEVRKSVRTVVRVGLDYDHRKVVIEARENGDLPSENAGLNGLEWVQHPVLLRNPKTGKLFVRAYPVRDAQDKPRSCKSTYRIDGKVVSREAAKQVCLANEFGSGKSPTECYNVPLEAVTGLRLVRRADAKAVMVSK